MDVDSFEKCSLYFLHVVRYVSGQAAADGRSTLNKGFPIEKIYLPPSPSLGPPEKSPDTRSLETMFLFFGVISYTPGEGGRGGVGGGVKVKLASFK